MNNDIPQYQNIGYTGIGYLVVRATTASEALPLEDATVTVYGSLPDFSSAIVRLKTGSDGLTPKIALAAPPRSLSASPESALPPFASYNITVDKNGFSPIRMYRVPIFDSITSIQPADMIPLPKNGYPDAFSPHSEVIVEGEALHNLRRNS